MPFPTEEIVVLDMAGDYARVRSAGLANEDTLKNLGFVEGDGYMTVRLRSLDARIELTKKLMELDALFSVGPGWSPAELIEYYREQGLVSGAYRAISWKNPEHYQVVSK